MTEAPVVQKVVRRAVPGKGNQGLYKYESDRVTYYYCRLQAKGRKSEHRKLESSNLNEAREEFKVIKREWEGKPPEEKKQVKLAREHWSKFESIKDDKSEGTKHSVKNSGRHLMRFFGDERPDGLSSDRWEDYIAFKRKEDLAKKYLKTKALPYDNQAAEAFVGTEEFKTYMAANSPVSKRRFQNDWKWLSSFLKYLHNAGHIARKPELRNPDPDETVGRVLKDEEVSALIKSSMESGRYHNRGNPRMRAKIVLSATTGMRNSECLMLTDGTVLDDRGEKLSWVDFETKVAHLRAEDTKIRKARQVPLPIQAVDELQALYALRGGPYILAPDPLKRPARAADKTAWTHTRRRAGVSCRFHDLRHTYLTKAFRRAIESMKLAQQPGKAGQLFPADCFAICEAAGLSLEEAQKTYLHLTVEDLRGVASLVTVTIPEAASEPLKSGREVSA